MHPAQRAFRQPAYLHEFERYYNYIRLQLSTYLKESKQLHESYEKALIHCNEDSKRLHQQQAEGIIVDSHTWNTLRRRKEDLTVQKSGFDVAKSNVINSVQSGLSILIDYYSDIYDDYFYKSSDQEQFNDYLKKYEIVFDEVDVLISLTSPKVLTIKKAIQDNIKQ